MRKPEHAGLIRGHARSRGGKASVFQDLVARLPQKGAHRVGAGSEELVLLTLILLSPPRGDDLDVGEAGPETLAQVPRPGEIARPDGGDTHDGRILLSHLGEDFARQGMRGARLEGDGMRP
jgi:hypothetical protein